MRRKCRRRKCREKDTALTSAIIKLLNTTRFPQPMPDNVRELIAEVDDQGWKALRVAQQEDRTIKTVTEDYGFLMRVRNEITSHYKQEPT